MACAKDGTQAAIGIHLKSTLLSICPVFFVLFFVVFVLFFVCVFCFSWFLFCLLSCWFVLALGNWIVYGLCKGPHLLSFVAFFTDGFACISIQFPASRSLCNDLAKALEALDGKKCTFCCLAVGSE